MNLDISKIKKSLSDNIIIIGLTLFFAQALWYLAKGVNTLLKPNYQIDSDNRHFSEVMKDDDEDILGI